MSTDKSSGCGKTAFAVIGALASLVTIIIFLTGKESIPELIGSSPREPEQGITAPIQQPAYPTATVYNLQEYAIPTEQPKLLDEAFVENGATEKFLVEVGRNEYILGSGYSWTEYDKYSNTVWDNEGQGCVLFTFIGPGHFEFEVTSGEWHKYKSNDGSAFDTLSSAYVEAFINSEACYAVGHEHHIRHGYP